MDKLQMAYDNYVSRRDKMLKNDFTFQCTVENGVLIADVTYDLTGFHHHFEVEDSEAGYVTLEKALANFEKDAYEKAEEGKNQRKYYRSKEHLEELRVTAASYAKNEAAETKMFDLFKEKDKVYASLTEAPTQEKQDQYMSILDQLTEIYRDRDNYRNISEAKAMKKELLQEQKQSQWNDIIKEFGQESPEAVVAMDMIELDDSVQPAEEMFQLASKEADELEVQIEAARQYAENAFIAETDGKNYQLLNESLTEDQIQDIIEKNPIVREDAGTMDILKDTFNLQGMSPEEINKVAQMEADKFNANHPVLATISMLAAIPKQLKESRENVKAAGEDYKTSVEKVAGTIALKTETFYNNAKMSAVERVQNVAERSASIYKEACNDFNELVQLAKKEVHKGVAKVVKASDIVLDAVTLGAWSNYCEKQESLANDKGLREVGYVGDNTYEGKILDMMEKDPNGLFSTLERKAFKKMQAGDNSISKLAVNAMELNESVAENTASFFVNLRNKALSGMEDYNTSTYWQEINDIAFVELQGEKNPADLLKDLAEKINNKAFELDNKLGVNVDKLDKKIDAAVEKVKDTFSKEHVAEMATHVKQYCAETKNKIAQSIDKAKSGIKSVVAKVGQMGKEAAEKVALGYTAVKVMSLENTSTLFERTADFATQAQRKCNAQVNALTEFSQIVHEKMEDINQAINNISSITPRERQPYKTPESVQQCIDLLEAAKPTSSIENALRSIRSKEAMNEKAYNAKEGTLYNIDKIKTNVVKFVQSSKAKAKLTEMNGWEKMAEKAIKSSVAKMEALDKVKSAFGKAADSLTQKAEQYRSQVDDLTDEYQR